MRAITVPIAVIPAPGPIYASALWEAAISKTATPSETIIVSRIVGR